MSDVVQFVDIRPKMPCDGPASAIVFQLVGEETVRMHVGALTNVDLVLVLDEAAEDFEEGGNVEELWTDL